jgi:hypothetical protein
VLRLIFTTAVFGGRSSLQISLSLPIAIASNVQISLEELQQIPVLGFTCVSGLLIDKSFAHKAQ